MNARRIRRGWIAAAILLLLVLVLLGGARLLYSPERMGPKPLCNVGLDFEQWMLEEEHKGQANPPYPNSDGSSHASLQQVSACMLPESAHRLLRDYAYVPGLLADDPQDLILLYVKERTRYTWHGDVKAVAREPAWLVFSPGFDSPSNSPEWCPESGRRLSDDEFAGRLQRTLDFLQRAKRPHWENVLKEHGGRTGSCRRDRASRSHEVTVTPWLFSKDSALQLSASGGTPP